MMFLMFFVLGECVSAEVVATVGYGVGRAAASAVAIQTSIWPRPRFAHVAYGIAMNGWATFFTAPLSSSERPKARPLTTSTPFRRSGRNAAVRRVLSGRTMLRTLPFGLSGHSAA